MELVGFLEINRLDKLQHHSHITFRKTFMYLVNNSVAATTWHYIVSQQNRTDPYN